MESYRQGWIVRSLRDLLFDLVFAPLKLLHFIFFKPFFSLFRVLEVKTAHILGNRRHRLLSSSMFSLIHNLMNLSVLFGVHRVSETHSTGPDLSPSIISRRDHSHVAIDSADIVIGQLTTVTPL